MGFYISIDCCIIYLKCIASYTKDRSLIAIPIIMQYKPIIKAGILYNITPVYVNFAQPAQASLGDFENLWGFGHRVSLSIRKCKPLCKNV